MDAPAAGHGAGVQMIDTSVVRVHRHGACIADNNHQDMGRSRGGLTSKIHAVLGALAEAAMVVARSPNPSRARKTDERAVVSIIEGCRIR